MGLRANVFQRYIREYFHDTFRFERNIYHHIDLYRFYGLSYSLLYNYVRSSSLLARSRYLHGTKVKDVFKIKNKKKDAFIYLTRLIDFDISAVIRLVFDRPSMNGSYAILKYEDTSS